MKELVCLGWRRVLVDGLGGGVRIGRGGRMRGWVRGWGNGSEGGWGYGEGGDRSNLGGRGVMRVVWGGSMVGSGLVNKGEYDVSFKWEYRVFLGWREGFFWGGEVLEVGG